MLERERADEFTDVMLLFLSDCRIGFAEIELDLEWLAVLFVFYEMLLDY